MNTRVLLSGPCAPPTRVEFGGNATQPHCGLCTVARSSRQGKGAHRGVGVRLQGDAPRPATELRATPSAAGQAKEEYIEVVLEKPLGLRFTRGTDGGAYITVNDAKLGATDKRIEVGDKIMQVSASFGDDVWDAKNFGQVMFAIRTRNGGVFLKVQRKFGDTSQIEDAGPSEAWKDERNKGNVGAAVREQQRKNYIANKKLEDDRATLFKGAMGKFRKNDLEGALIDFENVVAMEPRKYIGDNFARYTDIYPYAQYNAACCYAGMNQVEAGMEALEGALSSGFDDFDKVRNDANLAGLKKAEGFESLISKYDEPIINENAVRVLKNLFSFGGAKNEDED